MLIATKLIGSCAWILRTTTTTIEQISCNLFQLLLAFRQFSSLISGHDNDIHRILAPPPSISASHTSSVGYLPIHACARRCQNVLIQRAFMICVKLCVLHSSSRGSHTMPILRHPLMRSTIIIFIGIGTNQLDFIIGCCSLPNNICNNICTTLYKRLIAAPNVIVFKATILQFRMFLNGYARTFICFIAIFCNSHTILFTFNVNGFRKRHVVANI